MEELKAIQERIDTLTELEAVQELGEYVNTLNISTIADLITEDPKKAIPYFENLEFSRVVAVFRVLDFGIQEDLLNYLPAYRVAELINELAPDDRTALLSELPSKAVKELIKLLNEEERKITLSLLGYPEESVGRLMTPDYVDVRPHWTVRRVLDFIRKYGKNSETIDVIYVTDSNGVLLDDIRIRDFLLVADDTKVQELMHSESITLNVMDNQKETMQLFQKNNRVALPVVDNKNVLMGIVTIDDVLWVAEEEYTEDIQRIGGTEALDEPYLEVPFFTLIKKRAFWLIILFLGELLTATAMAYYESEISKLVLLASFVPLIISSGGNTGSQASTLIIQAMALDEVALKDWWLVLKRELKSGIVLGAILGSIGFLRIILWNALFHAYPQHMFPIAFTIGFSLLGVVLWGTLSGSMLPLFLRRLGLDPAVSSAPLVATLVDVTGLLIYFSMASFFLDAVLH